MVKVKSYEDNSIETEGKTRTIYLLFFLVAQYMTDTKVACAQANTERVLRKWKTKTKLFTLLTSISTSKQLKNFGKRGISATGRRPRNSQLVTCARNQHVTEDKRGKIAKTNLCLFWLAELKN